MKKTRFVPTLGELAELILAQPMALRIAIERDPNIVKRARALRVDVQNKDPGRRAEPIRFLVMLGIYQDLSQAVGKSDAKKIMAEAFSIAEGTLSNELSEAKKSMGGRSMLEEIVRLMSDWQSDEVQRELQKLNKTLMRIHEIRGRIKT